MKKLVLKLSMALFAVAFVSQANADILLEPYLGYHTGTAKQSGSSDTDIKGLTYGARVGYQTMGFMVGVDYMTGSWKDDSNPANDLTPADLGIFVGYNFPVMVRVYGAYVPTAKLKYKSSSSSGDYEGNAMKLGVGFTALPLVSVNLEILKSTYDESNGQSLTNKLDSTAYGLTVSLPFTF